MTARARCAAERACTVVGESPAGDGVTPNEGPEDIVSVSRNDASVDFCADGDGATSSRERSLDCAASCAPPASLFTIQWQPCTTTYNVASRVCCVACACELNAWTEHSAAVFAAYV